LIIELTQRNIVDEIFSISSMNSSKVKDSFPMYLSNKSTSSS